MCSKHKVFVNSKPPLRGFPLVEIMFLWTKKINKTTRGNSIKVVQFGGKTADLATLVSFQI